jgi:hypothetical protein
MNDDDYRKWLRENGVDPDDTDHPRGGHSWWAWLIGGGATVWLAKLVITAILGGIDGPQ